MSNNVYTETEIAAVFAQFSKVMELAREGQRPAEVVSRALRAVISDDDVVVVPKVTTAPDGGKILHVTGNARSAQEAIDALDCPMKWGLADKPAEIPIVIQPVDCRTRLVPLGQVRTSKEILGLYPKILNPAEFFALGAKFPGEQRDNPIVDIWLDAVGRFWYAILDVGGGQRSVDVYRNHPDLKWYERCRVPVRE